MHQHLDGGDDFDQVILPPHTPLFSSLLLYAPCTLISSFLHRLLPTRKVATFFL